MWLINTRTLELEAVVDSKQHKFAILSHTWGEGEVTFQDIQDLDAARKKPGFSKIEATCSIALNASQLKYAWIDTCCIDKTSSAELSEAINSMFAWYGDAEVCIVWLSDLEPMPCHLGLKERTETLATALSNCRWFTRGWTLQELIAPRRMEFFDKEWTFVGGKADLQDVLSATSGIESSVLFDCSRLEYVPVARRMSWAARRTTTRIEDQAYCLLGIFNINMPLLYGEGQKAFLRLQEAIASQSNDLSLFAWQRQHVSDEQTAMEQFGGIFADSPVDFSMCSTVKRHDDQLRSDHEFAITNNGLRIQAVLHELSAEGGDPARSHQDGVDLDPHVLLSLECVGTGSDQDGKPGWLSIQLAKVGSTYVRVHSHQVFTSMSRLGCLGDEPKTKSPIYIRRTFRPAENMRIQAFHNTKIVIKILGELRDEIDFVGIRPAACARHNYGGDEFTFETNGQEGFIGTLLLDLDRYRRELPRRYLIAVGLQWKEACCQAWYALFDRTTGAEYGLGDMMDPESDARLSEGGCLASIRDAMLRDHSDATGCFTQHDMPTSSPWESNSGGIRLMRRHAALERRDEAENTTAADAGVEAADELL
ncbi:hypothetical protein ACJZ2D_015686 [Fusarium nematophilum]